LDADVTGIDRSGAHAVVHVNGDSHDAACVVLALPPTHVARIRITPELPADHRHARNHQSFGLVIKVQVEYETPFWRDDNLSGTGFAPYELVHEIYDNSWDGSATGVLVGFVSDLNADTLGRLSDDERRSKILGSIASYFGAQAAQPITYVESDWQHQELTGGAYATSFAMGFLTRYGAYLREPVGQLRFGSSDVAGHGYQHVDGAIRMGTLLAEQILSEGAGK
jgi:putrescine oxidase